MDAHIGDGRQPDFGGRIDGTEVEEVQTIQEVLLDVADAVLDTPLLVAFGDSARRDVKPPMPGEIQIARIEHWRFADDATEHRRFQIIDHQPGRTAAKGRKGMLMRGQEVLHGLRNGEFDIHETAVAEHHDEK